MGAFADNLRTVCDKTKADLEAVAKRFTLDTFSACVEMSPVDTGRFRANWNVSIDQMDESVDEAEPDARGRAGKLAATTDFIYTTLYGQVLAGHIVFLTNSLPYALRLEYGWSQQAPSGMVRLTVERAEDILERAAAAARQIA